LEGVLVGGWWDTKDILREKQRIHGQSNRGDEEMLTEEETYLLLKEKNNLAKKTYAAVLGKRPNPKTKCLDFMLQILFLLCKFVFFCLASIILGFIFYFYFRSFCFLLQQFFCLLLRYTTF
jgi:hypothetical protein